MDKLAPENGKLRIETYRSGPFIFQIGIDQEKINPLLDRVKDAHKRFSSVPILPDVATRLEKEVVVSSVFGTNTIEGGTLTEEETANVIDGISEVKEEKERRVINIKNAYAKAEAFADECITSGTGITILLQEIMITDLHAITTNGLQHSKNEPGKYRNNQKGQLTKVGDSDHGGIYTPPKCKDDIEKLIKHFLQWVNSEPVCKLPPIIRAPLVHYYFERIHPFWDGNGRVGRVLEAIVLKCAGFKYAPFALSRYYLEHIDEYFTVFNLARKNEEQKDPYPNTVFVEFFLEGMLSVLNSLHDKVNGILAFMLYENFLNTFLQQKKINTRQFTIVNNLLPRGIEHDLSQVQTQPWYTGLYSKLTPKTKSCDLKNLEKYNLITITKDKKIRLMVP